MHYLTCRKIVNEKSGGKDNRNDEIRTTSPFPRSARPALRQNYRPGFPVCTKLTERQCNSIEHYRHGEHARKSQPIGMV